MIYQVYTRSFVDASGDGVGDLGGVTAKLDYLSWLGVDAIWLSPIYPSPMADFGYDVSDYTNVDPLFGTLEDLDALIEEAHRLRIKVILDFVPNQVVPHLTVVRLHARPPAATSASSRAIWVSPKAAPRRPATPPATSDDR